MKHLRKYNEDNSTESIPDFLKTVFADFFDDGIAEINQTTSKNIVKIDAPELSDYSNIDECIKHTSEENKMLLDIKMGISRVLDEYPEIEITFEYWDGKEADQLNSNPIYRVFFKYKDLLNF